MSPHKPDCKVRCDDMNDSGSKICALIVRLTAHTRLVVGLAFSLIDSTSHWFSQQPNAPKKLRLSGVL